MSRIAKVEFEGEWVRDAPAEVLVRHANGTTYWAPKDAVTVIDEPSNDPVGTVRKGRGRGPWVKISNGSASWLGFTDGLFYGDKDVAGVEVIGAAPGTEAASRRPTESGTREEVTP